MAYEKRLCVLKQVKRGFSADGKTLSGAVHAERLGSEVTLTVRLLDFAPVREGRYALAVWVGGRTYCHDLTQNGAFRISDAPSLEGGFSALVCFVRGEAEPVAYGRCGSAPSDPSVLLKIFSEEEEKKKKKSPPALETPVAPARDEQPFRGGLQKSYDDEAIAASDYFGRDGDAGDKNENAAPCGEEQEKKETGRGGARAHEEDGVVEPFRRNGGGLTYYNEIRERLEKAFSVYPKDERLLSVFPRSEWVQAEGSLLGIVYVEGRPRYLCVAVEKNGDPPEEMKDICVFVPSSNFTEDEGFYVVFQDADTGETVKTYDA